MFKLKNYATLDPSHRVNYVSMNHICTLFRSLGVNPASPILYWRVFLLKEFRFKKLFSKPKELCAPSSEAHS